MPASDSCRPPGLEPRDAERVAKVLLAVGAGNDRARHSESWCATPRVLRYYLLQRVTTYATGPRAEDLEVPLVADVVDDAVLPRAVEVVGGARAQRVEQLEPRDVAVETCAELDQ